jgi:thiol-disulfide isomerase/thioredoxin
MESLKGKVVVVDFWTYSCVYCVRTLPYLKAWYQTYKDQGLVIIGVHSPEFAFEHKLANVRRASADLGVTWPVVLDNSFAQWRAYGNNYWPALYFVDATGKVRYFYFGEGEYATSEQVIRKLLAEAGKKTRECRGGHRRARGELR